MDPVTAGARRSPYSWGWPSASPRAFLVGGWEVILRLVRNGLPLEVAVGDVWHLGALLRRCAVIVA
jgi:hypothetical protein